MSCQKLQRLPAKTLRALILLVAGKGFEPMTFGLWARRATRLLHPATTFFNIDQRGFRVKSNFVITSYSIHYTKLYDNSIRKGIFNSFEEVTSRQSRNWFHWIHFLDLHNRWRQDISKSNFVITSYSIHYTKLYEIVLVVYIRFRNVSITVITDSVSFPRLL